VKNGTKQFDAVMFAGYIGVFSGMKGGAFSISENQRKRDYYTEDAKKGIVKNLAMLFFGTNEISWIIRESLETCSDY